MQHLRLLSSSPPSMHANIIAGSENFPFYFSHIFTHLFSGTGLPTSAPFSAPPCPLPASPPCFLAGHTTCDAPSSDHVLSQAQALCTRLGRKGKLTRKWLATPHFANMLMCVSVGASVSLLARRVRPPLLQCLMMLPHPSISHRPPALGGGVNNNLSMGPRWMSDGLLPHCRSRLAAHLAVGSMVLVAGCGAGREVGSLGSSASLKHLHKTHTHMAPPLGLGSQERPLLSPPISLTLLGPASTWEPPSHPA